MSLRVEELVELAHTSIRQYHRPSGEVIALLVIAPSKTDRERVIPMSADLFHVIAMIVLRQTAHGPIPLVPRYDGHERVWTAPMPYLFQRQIGGVRKVTSPGTILNNLRKRCQGLGESNPEFRGLHFTPHDFRRLFATELVNNGLPIHIGAALLGHLNLQTTQGYVAVFEEDVIRHVQDFLTRRRVMRPQEEYRPATDQEWQEFEEHFDKRKVELGSCGRPYGISCQHEHACLRCAQLHINPKMLPRLDELEADLENRKKRASAEGWLGEIEGIDRTLQCLRYKRADALRLTRTTHLPSEARSTRHQSAVAGHAPARPSVARRQDDPVPQTNLDTVDAVELAELLQFSTIGSPATTTPSLRLWRGSSAPASMASTNYAPTLTASPSCSAGTMVNDCSIPNPSRYCGTNIRADEQGRHHVMTPSPQ